MTRKEAIELKAAAGRLMYTDNKDIRDYNVLIEFIDAANKLSAYEDTGLEPEQVMQTIVPENLRAGANWIRKRSKFPGGELTVVECSLCECQQWNETNFCPICGAKMEEINHG